MLDPTILLLGTVLIGISLSGFVLHHRLGFHVSVLSRFFPVSFLLVALAGMVLLRSYTEAVVFLFAALSQFLAFVFVSRMRQRGSYAWLAIASIVALSTWFYAMHILDGATAYWLLVIPFLAGIVVGRLIGVIWAEYIEELFGLKANVTKDKNLALRKGWNYIVREPMFYLMLGTLLVYLWYGFYAFEHALFNAVLVVVGLSFFQNLFYTIQSRATNRQSNVYIVITDICSSSFFFGNIAYLFTWDMPFELLVPYVLSGALGSTMGAFFSMLIELKAKILPDTHIVSLDRQMGATKHFQHISFIAVFLAMMVWLFANEPILAMFGFKSTALVVPFPTFSDIVLPREVVLLAAILLFVPDNVLHTMISRSGNRNHDGYHCAVCFLSGTLNFFGYSYIILYASAPDVLPIAVLAKSFGSLLGKELSSFIEIKLNAVMDVKKKKQ